MDVLPELKNKLWKIKIIVLLYIYEHINIIINTELIKYNNITTKENIKNWPQLLCINIVEGHI
jgi:hypothetical protein